MKFKVGDRVRVEGNYYWSAIQGEQGTIIAVGDKNCNNYDYSVKMDRKNFSLHDCNGLCGENEGRWFNESDLECVINITNNKNNMDLKEKFVLAVTPEPQKSFRKADIVDGDNLITQEGQRIFLTWLLGKYADEFKKDVVEGLLKKEE